MQKLFDGVQSILVIEDNLTDFALLEQSFKRAHYKGELVLVKTASDGYAWLKSKLDQGQELPSLILLDLSLPGESGMSVLERLNKTPELQKIAVVVYSGSESPTNMSKACLLYTSPSPRDQRGSRMPSSA